MSTRSRGLLVAALLVQTILATLFFVLVAAIAGSNASFIGSATPDTKGSLLALGIALAIAAIMLVLCRGIWRGRGWAHGGAALAEVGWIAFALAVFTQPTVEPVGLAVLIIPSVLIMVFAIWSSRFTSRTGSLTS